MSWSFGAAWTIVAGSLFLVVGTYVQAWYQIKEYADVLENAGAVAPGSGTLDVGVVVDAVLRGGGWELVEILLKQLARLRTFWERSLWWAVFPPLGFVIFFLRFYGLYSAGTLIWINREKIRRSGTAEKARYEELERTAVGWFLLLTGSTFVLDGAAIQLALAYLPSSR